MKFKIPYFIFCFCLYNLCTAQNKTEISIDSIPTHIKQYINRRHSSYQIRYFGRFIDSNKQVLYNIILKKKNKEIDTIFTESGKVISSIRNKFYTHNETIKEKNYKTPFPNL